MRKTILACMVALTSLLVSCGQSPVGSTGSKQEADKTAEQPSAVQAATDDEGWTFATVPLPDGGMPPRFVSNPDSVLSAEAEAELNRILLYAKVDLGIESCVVAVNHVANSDVESFSFALFENFKPNDNMLVIVLAYQDKGVRIEIGHQLEARISEVECQQLMNSILLPYLRENNPDEGMLSLVEAIYHRIEDSPKKR